MFHPYVKYVPKMCAQTSKLEESEKAYQYLKYIHHADAKINNKKVAEAFEVNQSRASTLLGELENKGLLESYKDGRKKIYEYSQDGIYEFFWQLVRSELYKSYSNTSIVAVEPLKEKYNSLNQNNVINDEIEDLDSIINTISDDLKPKFDDFLFLYVTNYFYEVNKSNLRKMLIIDLFQGLSETKDHPNYPKKFGIFRTIENHFKDAFEIPGPIVQKSLSDLNEVQNEEEE